MPSYVLVHYLKEDAPTAAEVLPPIIIQDDVPPAAENLALGEAEIMPGSLFAGFHLPAGSFPTSSSASSAKRLALTDADDPDDASVPSHDASYPPQQRGGKGGRGGRKQPSGVPGVCPNKAHNAASAMLSLTRSA